MKLRNRIKKIILFLSLCVVIITLSGCSQKYTSPGFYGHISTPGRYLMAQISKYVGSYGLAIVLFTIVIRFILLPLLVDNLKHSLIKQYILEQIRPFVMPLRKKMHSTKNRKIQKYYAHKILALYRKNHVSVASGGIGCLEVIIQLPIYMALYAAIRYSPQMHSSYFLGVNLGHSSWIFTIAAVISYGIGVWLSNKSATSIQNKRTIKENHKKHPKAFAIQTGIQIWMPLSIGLVSIASPAGVTIYFCISGIFMIGLQLYLLCRRPAIMKKAKLKFKHIKMVQKESSENKSKKK